MGKDYEFKGYIEVRHTIVPDEFFDFQMQDLSLAELKVLLYIFRRTFGFKKHQDWISMSQFVDGICKKTGEQLDRGTGLSAASVRRGTDGLLARGYICAQFYCPACKRPVEPDEMEQQARTQTVKGKKRAYSVTVVPKNCPGCSRSLYGQEQRWFSLVMGSGAGRSSDLTRGVAHGELGGSSTVNEGGSSPRTTQDTVYKTQSQDTVDKTPAADAAENLSCPDCLSGPCPECNPPNDVTDSPTSPHPAPPTPTGSHNPRAHSAFAADPETRKGWGGDNAATPSQAGGSAPIAEAIANQIVTNHNEIPGGLSALGESDRRAWVKMLQGVLDQYGPLTPVQARLVGDAWCVYNSYRNGPANPYHTSMPGDIGPLVARVLAGKLTAEGLRAEAAGKGKKNPPPPSRPKPQERTPEEEAAIRQSLAEQAERRKT